MTPVRHFLIVALLLWLAAVGQGRLALAMSIGVAQPDLPLVVLSCGAVLVGRMGGTWLGSWAGLLTAISFPPAYGSLFFSRIVAGTFAGVIGRSLTRNNLLVPLLVTLASTLIAELLTALTAPSYAVHHLRHWGLQLGGKLLYNSLLALPVSLLLRVLRVGAVEENTFGNRL